MLLLMVRDGILLTHINSYKCNLDTELYLIFPLVNKFAVVINRTLNMDVIKIIITHQCMFSK